MSAPGARDATTDESKGVVYRVTNQGSLIRTYTRWFPIAVSYWHLGWQPRARWCLWLRDSGTQWCVKITAGLTCHLTNIGKERYSRVGGIRSKGSGHSRIWTKTDSFDGYQEALPTRGEIKGFMGEAKINSTHLQVLRVAISWRSRRK